jgi:CRP-like cAMP-binding protein
MATVEAGHVLGWSWLVPPYVWHFQARTVDAGKALVLNGGHLLVSSEQNHYLGYELMKNMSRVILDVLLSAHQRWIQTGHRPTLDLAAQSLTRSFDASRSLGLRLVEHPFLHGMSPQDVEALASMASERAFDVGQNLFETGDPADGLYLVEYGRLIIEADVSGDLVQVQTISPGDAIGWSSFCEPYEWQFGCRALEPSGVLYFRAAELRERFASNYHFAYELTKRITETMLHRLQITRQRMWEAFRQ